MIQPDVAIRVENLGKKYTIRHQTRGSYLALRDVIAERAKRFGGKCLGLFHKAGCNEPIRPGKEDFWALKDASFEVKQGEAVGIIGRNGAGKTTLLKILSRITDPSTGHFSIRGRVSSLLEVGTGFHPELTGRENIFLNGAILGLTRREIKRKFDEIVDFAEIEKFLDTPIKRYSSGMYVRLAFAVAAHLEPEILLVDEVLAVGDMEFQRKCLGKMEKVAKGGRTVLFVSHNMGAIENLCSRVVVLDKGIKIFDGDTTESIEKYCELMFFESRNALSERLDRTGNATVKIRSFQILNAKGVPVNQIFTGETYVFRFGYRSKTNQVKDIDFAFAVRDSMNRLLFRNRTSESGISIPATFPSHGYFDCIIPRFPLTKGKYAFGFRLVVNGEEADYIRGGYAAVFNVIEGDYYGTGKITSFAPFVVPHHWQVRDEVDDSALNF